MGHPNTPHLLPYAGVPQAGGAGGPPSRAQDSYLEGAPSFRVLCERVSARLRSQTTTFCIGRTIPVRVSDDASEQQIPTLRSLRSLWSG
jgi:hypothetical protein